MAGAWTYKPGQGQVIFTTYWYGATDGYGPNGTLTPFSNRGRFRQIEAEAYLELGLTKRLTLVMDVPVGNLQYRDQKSAYSNEGFGDATVAARLRLNHAVSPWAISGQFTASVPGYKEPENPAPGNYQNDFEGRFLLGRGFDIHEHHVFFDGEAAYRYRDGAPADQLRGDVSTGVDAFRGVQIVGQMFSIKGLRNGSPVGPNSNPNAQSDFDLYKAQGSLVIKVFRTSHLQFGAGQTFAGRNTGRGATFVIGLWQRF